LKTIAKPIAIYLKAAAPKYQRLHNIYVDVGQRVHWITTKMNIIASGHKVLTINPLPEPEALSRGIDFLSEVFVFAFGGTIILVEFFRSEAKNAAKAKQLEEQEKAFKDGLEDNFQSLRTQISELQKELSLVEEVLLKENPTKYQVLKVTSPSLSSSLFAILIIATA
jgi:hypothetical protein